MERCSLAFVAFNKSMKLLISLTIVLTLIFFGVVPMASCTPETPDSSDNIYINRQEFEGVTGRVTTMDGRPIVEAGIHAKSLDEPSNPIPEIAIVTNEEGRYKWPLVAGKYEISVFIDNRQSASQVVTVNQGQTATLNFEISDNG